MQFGPKQRWTRYSLSADSSRALAAHPPATPAPEGNRRRDGVTDQAVIVLADFVDVALEGEGPVGRRPLGDIGHLASDRLRRDGIRDRQDDLGRDLDPERIVLRRFFGIATLPDSLVALEVRRRRCVAIPPNALQAGQVVDDLVSWLHPLRLLAVSRFQTLDGEAMLRRAREIIG